MKKLVLISALFCGIAFSANAQSANPTEEKNLVVSVEAPVAETPATTATNPSVNEQKPDDAQKNVFASTREEINKKRASKNKKDLPSFQDKPLYYIGAGVFIAVVVVLYVVTDGEGYSSR